MVLNRTGLVFLFPPYLTLLVLLLLLEQSPSSDCRVTIGTIYECSARWERMYKKRNCPTPQNKGDPDYISPYGSCLARRDNNPNDWALSIDLNICNASLPEYSKKAREFLLRLNSVVRENVPHDVTFVAHAGTTNVMELIDDICRSPPATSRLTLRQVFEHLQKLLFLDDIFIKNERDRPQEVAELTGELLCETWTNLNRRNLFMASQSTWRYSANDKGADFTLSSYLNCAGDLHRAAMHRPEFIEPTVRLYLAAEISTTILAVLSTILITISALGVFFAFGLSRFRRALLLNLCITDLANAWAVCLGEHLHLARSVDPYYFVWNILTFEMVLTLILLTFDFNLAIFRPLRYRYLVSKAGTAVIITSSWVFAVAISLALVFGARNQVRGLEMAGLCFYLVAILLVFIAHIVLLLKIFHIQTESNSLIVNVVGNKQIIEQTNRVAGTVVLVAVTTLVLVTPYCVYEFFLLYELDKDTPEQCYIRESKLLISELTADICIAFNCLVDPLLYILRLTDVRMGAMRAYRKVCIALDLPAPGSGTGSAASSNRGRGFNSMSPPSGASSSVPLLIYRPQSGANLPSPRPVHIVSSSSSSFDRGNNKTAIFPHSSHRLVMPSARPNGSGIISSVEQPLLPQQQQHPNSDVLYSIRL